MEETKETQADEKQEVPEKSAEAASEKKEVAEESTPEKPEATDKHGNDAIAKGKYQRDMQAKDDEIADLKNQIAESAKTEKGRKELETKIEALEGTQAEMRTEYELKLAGCREDKFDYQSEFHCSKTPVLVGAWSCGMSASVPLG